MRRTRKWEDELIEADFFTSDVMRTRVADKLDDAMRPLLNAILRLTLANRKLRERLKAAKGKRS